MSSNNPGLFTSLSSGPESDVPESLSISKEGYDYVFVPKLGSSYECPICLSVLREPRQTKCGHRFCRDCISHWMSDYSRCPVDNETLSESEIFPDNCIKREILSSHVKCPNHTEGCKELTTILQMQKHMEQCLLSLVPCPLNCFCVIPRRDIDDHQLNRCQNRVVTCFNCEADMPAYVLEQHMSNCPKEVVQCSHCSLEILRGELGHHIENECKSVVIPCPFHALGCNESVLREVERTHLATAVPTHLKMLATSFTTVLEGFSSLAMGLRQMKTQTTPTTNGSEDSQTTSISESGGVQRHFGNLYRSEGDSVGTLVRSMSQSQRPTSTNNGLSVFGNEENVNNNNNNDDNDIDNNRLSVENYHSYSSMPPYSSGVSMENRENASNTINNHAASPKLPLTASQSVPILCRRSVSAATENPSRTDQAFGEDIAQPNIAEFANGLQTVFTHQQQVIDKQHVIITNLCAKLASAESRLKHLEGDGIMGSAQNTCGDFYWSISDFSAHREKALREETSILHSPAFYSSPWGYKLCLRVNVNGTLNHQGEHFVSLFIHFMQGGNDHLLNWPFVGQIVLSIVDQNPVCKERKHAMETLRARPEIAAFQKPTSARNHKGFGYTDFISLNVLDNGNYVKDDTLIIRAQVFPTPP